MSPVPKLSVTPESTLEPASLRSSHLNPKPRRPKAVSLQKSSCPV